MAGEPATRSYDSTPRRERREPAASRRERKATAGERGPLPVVAVATSRERRAGAARDRRGAHRGVARALHPRRDGAARVHAAPSSAFPAASTRRSRPISPRKRSDRENVLGVRMPYRTSSKESLDHAQLVIDALGIQSRTIDISAAVDGYLANEPDADGGAARQRDGAHAHDHAVRSRREASRRFRSAPATRPSACSATSPGTPTTRRRSIRSAICSRRRCWALARHLGVPERDRRQAADGGSRRRPDRRRRFRHQLRARPTRS